MRGGETMSKGILIKGAEMPTPTQDGLDTFLDVRIYSDGSVLIPCGGGNCGSAKAEEIEYTEEQ